MPLIIPDGFGLMSWHTLTTGDPEEMIWTMGLGIDEAASVSGLPELGRDAWDDQLKPLTSSVVTLVRVRLRTGPAPTGPTYEIAASIAGTQGGSLPPPNCAVLIQKRSSLGGRANRGRAYLPGISSISGSLDSGGNFGSTPALAVSSAMDAMQNQMATDATFGPVSFVILHSAVGAPTPITEFVCPPKLATQRRRLRP